MSRIRDRSEINLILWRWFITARGNGYPISGPILQQKAISIAEAFQYDDFKASNGWLEKSKSRHNVKSYAISGESGNINVTVADEWKAALIILCEGFSPENIFNMDKKRFFFRALPNSTLNQSSKSCSNRITVVLTYSATGEKLKPIVIGKS